MYTYNYCLAVFFYISVFLERYKIFEGKCLQTSRVHLKIKQELF